MQTITTTTVKKTQQPLANTGRPTPSERPHKELTKVQEEVVDLASQLILTGGRRQEVIPLLAAHVALVVKRYAKRAGLEVSSFSGHSLRAGFVTSCARAGEPERRIMRTTGHKSIEMVLRYVRQANVFTDNAALALGL